MHDFSVSTPTPASDPPMENSLSYFYLKLEGFRLLYVYNIQAQHRFYISYKYNKMK